MDPTSGDGPFDPSVFLIIGVPYLLAFRSHFGPDGLDLAGVVRVGFGPRDRPGGYAVVLFTDLDNAERFAAGAVAEVEPFQPASLGALERLLEQLRQEGVTHAVIDAHPDRGLKRPIERVIEGIRRGPV